MARGAAILMYHAVGRRGEPPSRYVVPGRNFERQMRWLLRRGYRVVPLEAVAQGERRGRTVALTFDDGYTDALEVAAPVLERLGLPATVFAVSSRERNDWDRHTELAGRPLLDAEGLRALDAGIAVGAHTRTHPALTELGEQEVQEEVAGSRSELEQALGRAVTVFAYPYGMVDPEVRGAVERAGFVAACGVAPGFNRPGADPLALRRLEIEGTFSLPRFVLTLWVGDTHFLRRWRARRGLRRHPPERGVP